MTDSIDEFLKRGGKIIKCETVKPNDRKDSRYEQKDLDRNNHRMGARLRCDNYRKASGGKLPKDVIMYLKFRKGFGL